MTPPPSSLAEASEWLARAEQDLAGAFQLLVSPRPLSALAVFHAQQAAEKALTAFLVAQNVPFRLTHNLEDLLTQCEALNREFGQLRAATRVLTPYATRFRYPGGPLEPPAAEARQAIELAEQLLHFVRQQLKI